MILETGLLSYDFVYILLEKDKHQYPRKFDYHNCESHAHMSVINGNVHTVGTI